MVGRQTQRILNLIVLSLFKLELETPLIVIVLEKAIQNDLLVFLYDSIFALNES
jgi:hypothetical protein